LRASEIMKERLFNNQKITIAWNTVVEEIFGSSEKGVEAVLLRNVKTGERVKYSADGLFLAIGHIPNTEIFKGQLELDSNGYIAVTENTKASVPGVFAAGDAVDHRYRQAITAAGMGSMASLDAEKYLAALKKS